MEPRFVILSGLDVVGSGFGILWKEDLHIIDLEKEVYAATTGGISFDVEVRIGQGL